MKKGLAFALLSLSLLAGCIAPAPTEMAVPTPAAMLTLEPASTPEPTRGPAFSWTGDPSAEDDHAAVVGLGHIPLDELPQEVRDSLVLTEESPWEEMYGEGTNWCIRRVYTAPGLELTTTAPTAAYLEYKAEVDKDNYPAEDDFWTDIEGEEGREWIVFATITGDSYETRYGLKVGLTVEEAEALGYPLSEKKNFGAYGAKLEVTVEEGVITEMKSYPFLGRYIGKFFEM